MSARTTTTATSKPAIVDDDGIECNPLDLAQACGGCLMFLLSTTMIVSLGIIAGGAFWSAQSFYTLVNQGERAVDVAVCLPDIGENLYLALHDASGAVARYMEVPPCA